MGPVDTRLIRAEIGLFPPLQGGLKSLGNFCQLVSTGFHAEGYAGGDFSPFLRFSVFDAKRLLMEIFGLRRRFWA